MKPLHQPLMGRFSGALLTLLLFLPFFGCAIAVPVPTMHFESSEANGAEKIPLFASLGYGNFTTAELTPDYTLMQPQAATPHIRTQQYLQQPQFGYAPVDPLELKLEFPFGNSGMGGPLQLKVKYQFIGEPYSSAKPGNFSSSLVAIGKWGDYRDESTPPFSDTYRAWLTQSGYDLMLISGYRIFDSLLAYAGGYYSRSTFRGTWERVDVSSSAFSGAVISKGYTVGLESGTRNIRVQFEAARSLINANSSARAIWSGGLNLIYRNTETLSHTIRIE